MSQARAGAGCRCWPPPRSRSAGSAAPTVTAGDATATLQAELFQRDQVGLAVGGVLGDLVQEGADGNPGADRQGGLVDPFAGQRSDGPRPDQDAAVAVGEQPDGAARVALVGPGPVRGVGDADLGRGGADAAERPGQGPRR